MENITNTSTQIHENYWNYKPPYRQIANYMKARGLTELGDPKYPDRFTMADGERRPGGLDMDKIVRALRTLTIRKLSEHGLKKIHNYEWTKMTRFLCFQEIRNIAREPIVSSGGMSETQIAALADYNNTHRPECRQIDGITIPPYFPLDNEFDGMEYHHAWDWNVWHGVFDLPPYDNKEKKKT